MRYDQQGKDGYNGVPGRPGRRGEEVYTIACLLIKLKMSKIVRLYMFSSLLVFQNILVERNWI